MLFVGFAALWPVLVYGVRQIDKRHDDQGREKQAEHKRHRHGHAVRRAGDLGREIGEAPNHRCTHRSDPQVPGRHEGATDGHRLRGVKREAVENAGHSDCEVGEAAHGRHVDRAYHESEEVAHAR